jgi:hypothetical protein
VAILQALYKLNPIIPEHSQFDVTEDYPRADLENYISDVEQNRRDPAQVIQAYSSLSRRMRSRQFFRLRGRKRPVRF